MQFLFPANGRNTNFSSQGACIARRRATGGRESCRTGEAQRHTRRRVQTRRTWHAALLSEREGAGRTHGAGGGGGGGPVTVGTTEAGDSSSGGVGTRRTRLATDASRDVSETR